MSLQGLKFYRSETTSNFQTGTAGVIGAADVDVIKINYRWDQRGKTNVDLLRGLICRIVDHSDGLLGEVAVCENAQFNSVSNFDRPANNAADPGLSPHDVVVEFQGEGIRISHYDWTAVRNISVTEYFTGNLQDGYVVYAYDATLNGRVSYPKFRTALGTYVRVRFSHF